MNSIELRQQRAALVAESRKLVDRAEAENREFTAEETQEWERRMADVDKIEGDIQKAERREKLEAAEATCRAVEPRKSTPAAVQTREGTRDRNKLLKSWMSYGSNFTGQPAVNGDIMQRCSDAGMDLNARTINLRSLNTASGSAGGNATFTTTSSDIQTELKYYSPILSRVNLIQTGDGNTWSMPRGTDVANTMAIVSQSGSSGTSTDPTFDKVSFGSYYFRYIELVTYEMLADAVFNVEGWLQTRLAERAARTLEKYIVSGTGSSQPTGLVAAATAADSGTPAVTLASGHSTLYQFEDLFDLFKSVDLAYRPAATLVLNDQSVWALRKIKDDNGRYIWDVNNTLVQAAQPDSIAGFKYLVSNQMDAPAFSKNLAVFADLSRYVVRMAENVQITRLNELYRATGCIGFEVLMRFDGNYIGHAASIARLATPSS